MTAVDIELDIDGDQATIRPRGDIDMNAAADISALATAAFSRAAPIHSLVIDLNRVDFIDVAGVNGLVQARNVCDYRHAELRLRGVCPQIHRVLDLAGLSRWFGIPDGDGGRC